MIKILNVDITGKASAYDDSLYESLLKENKGENKILCLTPFKSYRNKEDIDTKLFCFVSKEKTYSRGFIRKLLKALEAFANYVKLGYLINKLNPNILHFQWLPFLEICSLEYYLLKLYKYLFKDMKIVLTVHNIYPHNSSFSQKKAFQIRFKKIIPMINYFIVHTANSVDDLEIEFGVRRHLICVIKHGAFVPKNKPQRKRTSESKIRFLMFGNQSLYKGTDLLLDAIKSLPNNLSNDIEISIVGCTSDEIAEMILASTYNINWRNYLLSDNDLNQEIENADVLVFPYRNISQSGALLLGLSFLKPIIASDLPSFMETLNGYPKEMFCKAGDADSLRNVMQFFLSTDEKFKKELSQVLQRIQKENSWEMSARDTLMLYRKLSKDNK